MRTFDAVKGVAYGERKAGDHLGVRGLAVAVLLRECVLAITAEGVGTLH